MKTLTLFLAQLTLVYAAFMSSALAADLSAHPGYVDFSNIYASIGAEPNVEVNLGEAMLSLVTGIMAAQDRQTAQAASFISKLLSVNVRVFNTPGSNQNNVLNSMTSIADELDARQWQRVVRVREESEHVDIYFRMADDASLIHGITIMVSGAPETVLINIVGDISPNDIAALAAQFNIDELAALEMRNENN